MDIGEGQACPPRKAGGKVRRATRAQIALLLAAGDNSVMQMAGTGGDGAVLSFVDRPKVSLRAVTLAVWGVGGFLLYKAVVERPPGPWILTAALAFFAVCSYAVIWEFMCRPVRVTTIRASRREVVVQETAPWRRKEIVSSIPPGGRFETFPCDSDNVMYFGVRIRSQGGKWVTIADYLSKGAAEYLAREANGKLAER